MTELERLVRIMFARTHDESWEQAEQITRETYLGDVRAVLEALKEPTEAMIDAAAAPDYHGRPVNPAPHNPYTRREIRREWQAMLSAILNEEPE